MKQFELLFKPKVIIPLAIMLSGLATLATYRYIQQQEQKFKQPEIKFLPIVVALQDLPMGTTLDATVLGLAEWPETLAPVGSFATLDFLLGRVVSADVYAKEPILATKLAPVGSSGGFSSVIPVGMRAATVSVNVESGVSGFILPDTYVDVVATVSPTTKKEDVASKIVLENIKVLAVDQVFRRQGDEPITVQSVTLLVTPAQSEKLVLACTEGKLQLTMRNRADSLKVDPTPGVWLKDLMAGNTPPATLAAPRASRPAAQAAAPATRQVEVIRAAEKELVSFAE